MLSEKFSKGGKKIPGSNNVRYNSETLARRSQLVGQKLRIYFDDRDVRKLKAFTQDGHPLGEMSVSGPWCYKAHSLRFRQEVFKAKRQKQLAFGNGESPIEAFVKFRRI